jgi:hypothetical protein
MQTFLAMTLHESYDGWREKWSEKKQLNKLARFGARKSLGPWPQRDGTEEGCKQKTRRIAVAHNVRSKRVTFSLSVP